MDRMLRARVLMAEAVQLGAAPGFGKASLGQPAMLERLRPFLE